MSVRKSHRGKWMIHAKIRRPNGEIVEVRRVSPVNTRRGAERYEREIRELIARGEWTDKPRATAEPAPTLDQWVEIFVNEHSRAKHLRPSSIDEQRRMFRLYLLPVLGASTRIDAIGTPQFERVRRAIAARGLSAKTTNNALGVLSRAVRYFYERQGLDVPHFDGCRVKVRPGVPTFWEPDQYQALVNVAAGLGPRELAIVLLMGDCGLRTGEVIALEWSHVRWSPDPQLVIQRGHWRGHFGPPKGGRPRTVPMTDRVAAVLRSLPRRLGCSWVLARDHARGEAGHETHASLGWALGKVERAAGFGKQGSRGKLHKLRHTYVTRLAAAGVQPLTIRDLAGHTRLETTMRYMHLLPGAGTRAVEALQAFDQEHHRSTAAPPITGSVS